MLNIFSKKEEEENRALPGYEETERRTPKAGYILLIMMFFAALFFGWRAIDDLQEVPSKPELLSHCAGGYVASWEFYGSYSYLNYPVYEPTLDTGIYPYDAYREKEPSCAFSEYETKFGIPALYDVKKNIDRKLQDVHTDLSRTMQDLAEFERAYQTALLEKIANVGGRIYSITELQQRQSALREDRTRLESERDKLYGELKVSENALRFKYAELISEYRIAWRWYEFKVFLLEAIFVVPFFLLVFWAYRRLLAQNSPYTIIFTALVGVASVLFLRILLVWFWSLFLARLIQTIWEFIQNFALLRSLVFYGGMLLSIAVFGGAVYLLQKRIFDPRRVAIRRLRDKQCPNCQASLDLAVDFCPNCGRRLKEKCASCGRDRWADLANCQHCGAEK